MADRPERSPSPSVVGLFLRTWWMLIGNGALCVALGLMAFERDAFPSQLDAVFATLVASLLVVRLVDIRYFEGATAEGARATMEHFRRYVLRLLAGSAVGWGAASSLAAL
jgi:hypothetical protein